MEKVKYTKTESGELLLSSESMDTRTQEKGKRKAFQVVLWLGIQESSKAGHCLSVADFSCTQKTRSCKYRFAPKILDSKTNVISSVMLKLVSDRAVNARLQESPATWTTKRSKM